MKKAELESHQARYYALMSQARAAEQDGLYRTAIKSAIASWQFIDGMMQYERRFQEREFDSVEAIDMVLRYAPVLMDFQSLDVLDELLRDTRRIEKNTSTDLGAKLAKARERMWNAHRLWGHLERHPGSRQDELARALGGEQDEWRSIAEAWHKMGLMARVPEGRSYRLSLATRMGEIISAKCPSCGTVSEAPKAAILQETACPDCRNKVVFVILPRKLA